MKKYRGMKITLIILTIILISLVSFIGIYVEDKNQVNNIMPEYLLARDLEGYRRIELKVNDEIAETIKYDDEGNVLPEDNTEIPVARIEEKKVNEKEVLTEENYKISKKIIEKRLNKMQVTDYIIRQDKTNGTIILELPENKNTDRVVGQIALQGKFEIVDNETNEVLMTNSDLKSVKAGYGSTQTGTTAIFLNINFNKEGTEKFKNITNTYIQTIVEKEEKEENTNEVETEEVATEETENEKEAETVTKQIAIKIDGSTLLTTYFDTEISNGILQLSVGSSTNATNEEMQEYLLEANSMAALLDSNKMPIVYEVEQNKYIYSNITTDEIGIVISIVIVVLVLAMVYHILKYKTNGILSSISQIGYIAILLIALRIFNVEISFAGIIGIILSIVLNYFIVTNILKQNEILKVIKKWTLVLIPTLIIAIVFIFMNISMGMELFWALTIGILYNLSITNIMLKD